MIDIDNKKLIKNYINKHNLHEIFDNDLLNYSSLSFYESEELILEGGEGLKYLYLLVDGRVRVSYSLENGREMPLKFYRDFELIGDIELLNRADALCKVEAISGSYLIKIPVEIVRGVYMGQVKFLTYLTSTLSEKLYTTILNNSYNYVYPLRNRLASYLLVHANSNGVVKATRTYKSIAELLGTSYRHLSRTLREFEKEGIAGIENKDIHIKDMEKVEALSKNLYNKSF